ncbi:MAG TPA: cation:proton antiporter, partial [Methanomassiliicoccales archaeon]|nr:cation:proton antiporter [Methanomassiliicoccales archaeon]
MNDLLALAFLMFLAVSAQLIASRFGLSAAIFEILLGLAVGQVLGLRSLEIEWFSFLAVLGGIGLTFLAGTEMEVERVRSQWKSSLPLALASFLSIFITVPFALHYLGGWSWDSSLLAGIALSETSVAIVYVVLVEGGRARTDTGSVILAACFLTNLIASIALAVLFAPPGSEVLLLILAGLLLVPLAYRYTGKVLDRFKGRPGEPEIKLVLLPLLLLAGLASMAGVAAVLPAYLLGFAMSRSLNERREAWSKVRTVFLGFMVSLFFLAAGSNVSMEALLVGAAIIIALGFGRVVLKMLFVLPTVSVSLRQDRVYIALLMSTSLTFGMV